MIDLKNLNIILTGATGGIGGSILEKLYNCKCKYYCNWNKSRKIK